MISARIFLILFAPLLTHGAPTPPGSGNAESFKGLSQSSGTGSIILGPPLPGLSQTIQPAYQPPHHDQPLTVTESTSADAHPNPQNIITYNKKMNKNVCILPINTVYLIPAVRCKVMKRGFTTKANGMAVTLQGGMIFLPEGTTITISKDQFSLPTDAGIQIINDWNDPRTQTIVVLPRGTIRRTHRQETKARTLTTSVESISGEWIVSTPGPEYDIIFLPHHTSVIILPTYVVHLPTGETGIQRIGKTGKGNVINWCNDTYDRAVFIGVEKEPREEYQAHCFSINVWNLVKGLKFVPVVVRPMMASRPQHH